MGMQMAYHLFYATSYATFNYLNPPEQAMRRMLSDSL